MPSLARSAILSPFRAVTILLALLLAAHAPMILNDGLFMDDWLVLKVRPDYAIDIGFLLNGAGHPVFYSYDYIANLTDNPILVMKVLAFAGIFLGAVCMLSAAMRLKLMSCLEGVGFALIVWTYPGYQLWAGKANAVYVFSFGLVFVGAWLLTLAFGASGLRHVLLRVVAALVFLLSFALNSTMVLYGFLMLGLFFAVWRAANHEQNQIRRAFLAAWRCATGYPELVALPVVYWGVLNIFFKRVGVYAGHYNVHIPTPSEFFDGARVFFLIGYRNVLSKAAHAALDSLFLFALAAVLIAFGFLLIRSKKEAFRGSASSVALPLLLCPIVFFASALPYLIAGLRPADHFYESRHLLMFGLPLALGLLATKRLAESVVSANVAFAVVFGAASILSIAMLWNGYVFMQARVLRQEALSSHLAVIAKPAATVFAVNNGFLDYPSTRMPFGVSEVSGMLRLAWGNQPFLGFTLGAERPTFLHEMEFLRTAEGSAFHNIDPSGPQATITGACGRRSWLSATLLRVSAAGALRCLDVPDGACLRDNPGRSDSRDNATRPSEIAKSIEPSMIDQPFPDCLCERNVRD
jgi:hypothetical protein